jgi:RNA polymerase sigma-70 factor (ECF subfamily)
MLPSPGADAFSARRGDAPPAIDPPGVAAVFRREQARVVATLIRLLRDVDLAEDAAQEAMEAALVQWPRAGLPDHPRAWLVNVGRHKAIDRLRRQIGLRARQDVLATLALIDAQAEPPDTDQDEAHFGDDMLRLIFTCCHPALAIEAQVALTLHTICGIATEEIARAFLVSRETVAQRLVRAKRKIREAGIPYVVPGPAMLQDRVSSVTAVIYLVFSEGYARTAGDALMSEVLAGEAIRTGRLLDELLPGRPAIIGLLALMLLHHARRHARVSADGDIILLEAQDRALWDHALIAEGAALVERALRLPGPPASYAVQAAIAALHAQTAHYADTDWRQIVGLYEVLLRLHPSPVIELNHAAAVAMRDGPERGLELLDALAARCGAAAPPLLPAVRADLLRRLGHRDEARAATLAALALTRLEPERRLLQRQLAELG